ADDGFPQRRRRVFIVGRHLRTLGDATPDGFATITTEGILAHALPAVPANGEGPRPADLELVGDAYQLSAGFGIGRSTSPFDNAGFMAGRKVWTQKMLPNPLPGHREWCLGDVVVGLAEVPEQFIVPKEQLGEPGVRGTTWRYLKGPKSEPRRHAASNTEYRYSEGGMCFPDDPRLPSRTILTGEGGRGPSRFKHVIEQDGVYRRLTPVELERLNGFPDGWTQGMPDSRRAFCMGNALVVGLVRAIGDEIARDRETRK
ncbi:MAG: DNA cytosine methyltransferase, partial [Coriobacteriales bacterium]